MLCREIIAVCSEIHTKHINTAGSSLCRVDRQFTDWFASSTETYLSGSLRVTQNFPGYN